MANLSNINNILRTNSTGVGIFADAGSYPLEISSAGTAGVKLINTAGATYDVYANASEEFIIAKNGVGNRLTISSGGNVGIGTDSPSKDLVVSNGGAEGIEFDAGALANLSEVLAYNRSTSVWNTMRNSALAHEFYISGVEKMKIDSSGNSTFAGNIALSDSGQLQLGTGNDSQIYHTGSHLFIDNSVGSTYIRNTSTSSILLRNSTGGDIQFDNEFAGNILFNTSNITRLTINSVGDAIFGGDVQISGSANEFQAKSGAKIAFEDSTPLGTIRVYNDGAAVSRLNIGDAMWVQEGLNVGIGTSSPLQKLQVQTGTDTDGIIITGDGTSMSTGEYRRLGFRYSATDGSYSSEIRFEVPNSALHGGAINFLTHISGTPTFQSNMYLDEFGRVGIGTTSPATNLHIDETTSNSYGILRLEGSNRGGELQMYNGIYPVSNIITDQSGNMYFQTSGVFASTILSTKFTIATAGNVGIGVTGPTFKLDVGGNGRFSGFVEMATGGAVYQGQKFYLDGGGDTFLESPSSNLIEFTTNGVKKMSITSAGEVKIGTTAGANAKLHVVSTAKDRKVMIEGNASNQGAANNITLVNHYPVVSAGTQLIIPFTSQGNLNSTTIIKIFGHSARFNSSDPRGFEATIQLGHLSQLYNVSAISSSGNISGVSTSGMNLIISFTTAYTNPSLSDGVYATINYMTNNISYSLQPNNIVMN